MIGKLIFFGHSGKRKVLDFLEPHTNLKVFICDSGIMEQEKVQFCQMRELRTQEKSYPSIRNVCTLNGAEENVRQAEGCYE
jgi:hypothetical protein